ncbi:MAG: FeoA domain-containing protein [Puniceicoccaceae bacterium]
MLTRTKGSGEDGIRTLAEDILKAVAHRKWLEESWSVEELQPRWSGKEMKLGLALELLERVGHLERAGGKWRLSAAGRERAVELLRAHRLVETYLARKEGLPTDALHAEADKAEHYLSSEGINQLADSLNRPRFDPHGDPIPEREHDLHEELHQPLAGVSEGNCVRIAHIEDEPEEDFEQLTTMGLALELPIKVLQKGAETIRIELAGEALELSARLASHVEIVPLGEDEIYPDDLQRLASLKPGEQGTVAFISPACMGPERHRLLDFGLVPGSEVSCEFSSPFGSPIAYSLRGSTIGLRLQQARNIFIRREA